MWKPEAGVDEEHLFVHEPDLHRPRRFVQQHLHCRSGVGRNAMGAAEIVERALRQHAECAATAERGLGHGVDGAVAASRHDDAVRPLRQTHRLARQIADALWVGDDHHVRRAAGRRAGGVDCRARLGRVAVTRAHVEDDEERRLHGGTVR